jgi:hypothetical protein
MDACAMGPKRSISALKGMTRPMTAQLELALVRDQVHVREVHGRNDERHLRVTAVVFCVAEDGDVGLKEGHF